MVLLFYFRFGHELESPVNGSPMDTMSDFPGGRVSPTLSPSSSPKTKRPPRIRPPKSPSSDDESEGETRKPSKYVCSICRKVVKLGVLHLLE